MVLLQAKLQRLMQRSFFTIFFLYAVCSHAQVEGSLYEDGVLKKQLRFSDSVQLAQHVNGLVLKYIDAGYHFTGVDSILQKGIKNEIYLHKGSKGKVDVPGLSRKNLAKSLGKKMAYYSNRGYPYVSVSLDSTRTHDSRLIGKVKEEKGPFVSNDSAFFFNDVKTNHSFIYQLLDHIPGKPFNESSYRSIDGKVERVSFLRFRRPVDVSFQDNKATIYLDIEERASSSFEGVLGLQQVDNQSNVVGSIDLNIQNLFRSGKELALNWERFAESSQALNLTYRHSFFLDSKLTPFFDFQLLRQDTTFLRRATNVGITTFLSTRLDASFGYTKWRGTLLTEDEQLISESNLADFSTDFYEVKVGEGRLETFTELQSNVAWEVGVGGGIKQIVRNISLPDSFYDTLTLETDMFRLDAMLKWQTKIAQRQTFFQQVEFGSVENSELLDNEKYRIGGLNSLRGFNEKFFFADRYFLSRSEFRTFFEKGSYFYIFYDQLVYSSDDVKDSPFGTGLGFSLSTLSGQFSFALAVGKSLDQPLDLANIKAHFGYITRF